MRFAGRPAVARRADAGFALLYALGMVAVLAAGAHLLISSTRAIGAGAEAQLAAAEARAAAEAAVVRGLFAMREANDPMHGALSRGEAVARWRFAGAAFDLALEAEGGRVDLNVGAPELIEAVFAAADGGDGRSFAEEARARRAQARALWSADEISGPCHRLGGRARTLRAMTTRWTRSPSIDPRLLPRGRASALADAASPELQAALAAALASPNSYPASAFLNVAPPVFRLATTRVVDGGQGPRRDVILRRSPGRGPALAVLGFEDDPGGEVNLACR